MYKGQSVSVILPTYNEKDSIRDCINVFFATKLVDQVIVVNNNAAKGTKEEVEKTKAIQIFEKKQGYGFSIRAGLKYANTDLILVCEPDATFLPNDLHKFLAYSDDVDFVIGSRTTRALLGEGVNMGLFLKWGNWFVAKMVEFLFNTRSLTDVGCTYRLIKKKALRKIQPKFKVGTSHFGLEMMLWAFMKKIEHIEIPITYKKRVGESSVTGDFTKTFALGMTMIFMTLNYFFNEKTS